MTRSALDLKTGCWALKVPLDQIKAINDAVTPKEQNLSNIEPNLTLEISAANTRGVGVIAPDQLTAFRATAPGRNTSSQAIMPPPDRRCVARGDIGSRRVGAMVARIQTSVANYPLGVGLFPTRTKGDTTLIERDRLERVSEALQAASKVFDTTGEVFFRSLTEHLSSVLHVDYVSIGELSDGGRRIRTVAVSAGGKNLENLEYELDHTPCQQVLERGRFFDHRDVQSHFPHGRVSRADGLPELSRSGPRGFDGRAAGRDVRHEPAAFDGSNDCRADTRAVCGAHVCRDGAAALGTGASGKRSQESRHPESHP